MFTTISESTFVDTFDRFGRSENFSREGRRALFAYFEELEAGTGTPIEFDCVAICCEYYEMSVDDIISDYRIDVSECEDEEHTEAVREYMRENTSLVAELGNGCFVFACF